MELFNQELNYDVLFGHYSTLREEILFQPEVSLAIAPILEEIDEENSILKDSIKDTIHSIPAQDQLEFITDLRSLLCQNAKGWQKNLSTKILSQIPLKERKAFVAFTQRFKLEMDATSYTESLELLKKLPISEYESFERFSGTLIAGNLKSEDFSSDYKKILEISMGFSSNEERNIFVDYTKRFKSAAYDMESWISILEAFKEISPQERHSVFLTITRLFSSKDLTHIPSKDSTPDSEENDLEDFQLEFIIRKINTIPENQRDIFVEQINRLINKEEGIYTRSLVIEAFADVPDDEKEEIISYIRMFFGDSYQNNIDEVIEALKQIPKSERRSFVGIMWPIIHQEKKQKEPHSNYSLMIANAYQEIKELKDQGIRKRGDHEKRLKELYEQGSLSENPTTPVASSLSSDGQSSSDDDWSSENDGDHL